MDIYREVLLEHYKDPHNFGDLPDRTVEFEEYNPFCGDRILLQLKIERERVTGAKFKGEGCAFSTASASMLTDFIRGRHLKELKDIKGRDLLTTFGLDAVSPGRLKCALLPLESLRRALAKL